MSASKADLRSALELFVAAAKDLRNYEKEALPRCADKPCGCVYCGLRLATKRARKVLQ